MNSRLLCSICKLENITRQGVYASHGIFFQHLFKETFLQEIW